MEHNIAGTRESVRGISRNDIIEYLQKLYAPQNAVLVITGKIDKNTKKVLSKYFNQHSYGKNFNSKEKFKQLIIRQNKPQINLNYKKTNQAHIALGFPAFVALSIVIAIIYQLKRLPLWITLGVTMFIAGLVLENYFLAPRVVPTWFIPIWIVSMSISLLFLSSYVLYCIINMHNRGSPMP